MIKIKNIYSVVKNRVLFQFEIGIYPNVKFMNYNYPTYNFNLGVNIYLISMKMHWIEKD